MWTIFYGWSEWGGLQEEVQPDYLLLLVALFDTSKYINNEFKLTDCHLQVVFNANGFSCITLVLAQFQFHCRKIKDLLISIENEMKCYWRIVNHYHHHRSHEWKAVYCAPTIHIIMSGQLPHWLVSCGEFLSVTGTATTKAQVSPSAFHWNCYIKESESNLDGAIIVMEMIVNLSSVSTSLSSH